MDNYTDHYDVLIELNIGYLENYVTMILWQLNWTEAPKLVTVSWFRYEDNKHCLNTFYVPQVLDDDILIKIVFFHPVMLHSNSWN